MEIAAYEEMYEFEKKFWWWVGKRNIVKKFLDILNLNSANILDAGCGAGLNLNLLRDYGTVIGLDFSDDAIKFCKMNNNERYIKGNAMEMPFKSNTFDLIIALDILEHLDDKKALKEFNRILKKNGSLIITVPAFKFLWSKHDEALHHKIRYNKDQLQNMLQFNGFAIEKISYWNFFLFLPIIAMRFLKKMIKEEIETDFKELPNIVNRLFTSVLIFENLIILHSVLPFGLSIFCLCKKIKGH